MDNLLKVSSSCGWVEKRELQLLIWANNEHLETKIKIKGNENFSYKKAHCEVTLDN